ncbi:hypothetical protein [Methylobacterium sp. CCH5-D2]|uniref:hypothetical protein n=1 Tax=Methylobacterium sp. CCH5-D2 TaxID=1768765 RepID=UPI00082FD5AE|nr:hypothetical protein [Methylobacterium sp. CCH5-D2]
MRALRETALIASAGNALIAVNPNQPSSTFDILAFARTVLGKGSDDLLAVVTWARIMAEGGRAEGSIAEWCSRKGDRWSPATFHRRRKRACERITAAKNAADLKNFLSQHREAA